MRHHRLLLPVFLYILTSNIAYSLDVDQNYTSKSSLKELEDNKDNLPWDIGLSLETTNPIDKNYKFESLWGLQLGKDLTESKRLVYGVQTMLALMNTIILSSLAFMVQPVSNRFPLYNLKQASRVHTTIP